MTYRQQLTIRTTGRGDMHDLTEQGSAAVAASGIQSGTVNVFNVGSTAAVGTIEFEPGLQHDLPNVCRTSYGHEQAWHDGNGHSRTPRPVSGVKHPDGGAGPAC